MKNGEIVRNWRKSLGYSQRELAQTLNQKINADIPQDDPRHYAIYQPDLNKVENDRASKFVFEKIVNAIYKYMGVEHGQFGEYEDASRPNEGSGEEPANPYVHLYEGIKLRDRIIELMEEKEALMARVSELEAELEARSRRIEDLEAMINAS